MDNISRDAFRVRIHLIDSDRYPGANQRDPSYRIDTEAVDTTVQSHKDPIHIYHCHCTYVVVPRDVFLYNRIVRILLGLFDGHGNLDPFWLAAVDVQDLYKNLLSDSIQLSTVQYSLISHLSCRNISLHAEQLNKYS